MEGGMKGGGGGTVCQIMRKRLLCVDETYCVGESLVSGVAKILEQRVRNLKILTKLEVRAGR